MNKDWLFTSDEYICDLRTVGVLIKDNMILVQRDKSGNEYALPGGHIKIGETPEEGLIREIPEEMGVRIKCNRLLWSEECFWERNGKQAHTIAFYYQIELRDDLEIPENGDFVSQKDNCNAEIVKEIFRRYLDGASMEQIADSLNSRGLTTKGIDSPKDLHNRLHYEKSRKNNGELPMYLVKNHHGPIISRADFNRVQKEINWRCISRIVSAINEFCMEIKIPLWLYDLLPHCYAQWDFLVFAVRHKSFTEKRPRYRGSFVMRYCWAFRGAFLRRSRRNRR